MRAYLHVCRCSRSVRPNRDLNEPTSDRRAAVSCVPVPAVSETQRGCTSMLPGQNPPPAQPRHGMREAQAADRVTVTFVTVFALVAFRQCARSIMMNTVVMRARAKLQSYKLTTQREKLTAVWDTRTRMPALYLPARLVSFRGL
ncbi:uncharacterized protein LAESUDRAFT_286243 [Laetiporus sulphureus 93-53]|uniref:Uncharacterized protein n=1 Tax=Laetiporus sulphureus 93-53 TaxID=1314785 RepID=A0A165DGY2_9APHY|nr:uncharacterized protein LAESUDRAFT_286243 [Laetiporus sulphureus 93-53]KZT04856.1 hypothetical protein LAESUDRAFT_286243 [Laetiporus sulphureus 93-53]